ncbi:T9SS type A sorting domain-containing protein [Polaribacter marinaquae]|uniref:T9SS type A sorting domain-containing protein n=1 Tax=Polaribacter marinaquae TaxID=1642819 RepID=UPI0036306E9B
MYPNPVKNRLFINFNEKTEKIQVYNTFGRVIKSNTNLNNIDLSDLKNQLI